MFSHRSTSLMKLMTLSKEEYVLQALEDIEEILRSRRAALADELSTSADFDKADIDKNTAKVLNSTIDDLDKIDMKVMDAKSRMNRPTLMQQVANRIGLNKLTVQLLFTKQVSSGLCSSLMDFLKKLAKRSIRFRLRDTESIFDGSKPVLVVCLCASRLEADIDIELSKLRIPADMRHSKLAVLLLHLGTAKSLPQLPTSVQVGTESKYANIMLIDLAYDQKFYKCEMNEIAKEPFNEFLDMNSV